MCSWGMLPSPPKWNRNLIRIWKAHRDNRPHSSCREMPCSAMLNSYLLTISPAEHCACRGGGEKTITVWTGLYRYSSVWKATKHLYSYHTLIVYVGIANERKLIPQHWVYPDNICPSVGCAWKWRFEPRVKSVRYRKEKAM